MTHYESATIERATRLRRMTAEYVRDMKPHERDRLMQVHLAQARGPIKNVMLLRQMTATVLRIRKGRQTEVNDE
jgi:hypothetical protein